MTTKEMIAVMQSYEMTTKEMIAVMQAYEDGKKIQFKTKASLKQWKDIDEPHWDWELCDYRIKPEEKPEELMTHRQLAKWCADNNGQVRNSSSYIRTYHNYSQGEDNVPVSEETRIRPWGSEKWIKPTKTIYEQDCTILEATE